MLGLNPGVIVMIVMVVVVVVARIMVMMMMLMMIMMMMVAMSVWIFSGHWNWGHRSCLVDIVRHSLIHLRRTERVLHSLYIVEKQL